MINIKNERHIKIKVAIICLFTFGSVKLYTVTVVSSPRGGRKTSSCMHVVLGISLNKNIIEDCIYCFKNFFNCNQSNMTQLASLYSASDKALCHPHLLINSRPSLFISIHWPSALSELKYMASHELPNIITET